MTKTFMNQSSQAAERKLLNRLTPHEVLERLKSVFTHSSSTTSGEMALNAMGTRFSSVPKAAEAAAEEYVNVSPHASSSLKPSYEPKMVPVENNNNENM